MKEMVKKLIFKLLTKSLRASSRQRNEENLKYKLKDIVKDLTNQYSHFDVDMNNEYLVEKLRGQHAFQISMAMKAIDLIKSKEKVVIGDIGDSAGTHILYLQNLLKEKKIESDAFSVNLDERAIKRIQDKGLKAIHCRAEDLHKNENINVDIFLSFEMIEHLFDPISFLNSIATNTNCKYFVVTVPNVFTSRVGFAHIRDKSLVHKGVDAESTHIFELSPDDWNLIFQFSGWEIVYEDSYTQYPKWHWLYFTKYLWRKLDFDGFHGVILKRNLEYSERYTDW